MAAAAGHVRQLHRRSSNTRCRAGRMNSVIVAAVATAFLCVLFGAMAGYALARLSFPGREPVFLLFLASLMIPPRSTSSRCCSAMIKVGWASTYQALILPLDRQRVQRLHLPPVLPDLPARARGGGDRSTAPARSASSSGSRCPWRGRPLIAATVIIFTLNWNNFLWPLLVTFDEDMKTLPGRHRRLHAGRSAPPRSSKAIAVAMAGVTLLCMPSVAAVPPSAALLHPGHPRAASSNERRASA